MRWTVVLLLCGLSACATSSAPPPSPALVESRLLGLRLGDPPQRAVEVIASLPGATLLRQLSPVGSQRVLNNRDLEKDPEAMTRVTRWQDPAYAGQFVARLDDGAAALQAWVTVCAGEVRAIDVSYSPGTAEDALDAWARRFPDDRMAFPASQPVEEHDVSETVGGRRVTERRELMPGNAARTLMSESVRRFVPQGRPAQSVAQLVSRRLQDYRGCPDLETARE